jgi:hypothetical protein
MQNYPSIESIIKSNATIKQAAAADLEWNWNGIAQVSSISLNGTKYYEFNIASGNLEGVKDLVTNEFVYDEYLESLFPLKSIVEFIRPGSYAIDAGGMVGGIAKARANSINSIFTSPTSSIRNYVSSAGSYYKYWSSKNLTDFNGVMDETIEVVYDRQLKTNKLVVKFETSSSIPKSYSILVRRNNIWQSIFSASNTPLTNGGLALYWNGTSWTTSAPGLLNHLISDEFDGVRLVVTAVNFKDLADRTVSLELIEISPRLVTDVSDNLISWDVSKSIFEQDRNGLPVGISSSNTASMVLENTDNRFNNNLQSSSFFGLLEQNVKVRIYSIIEDTKILQFTGYVDEWNSTANDEVNLSARDISKFLQEVQAPDLLLGAPTNIGQIVRTVLDSAGFNELIFVDPENIASIGINYFWSTSDKSVLEALQDVCYVHQCALHVDEFGRFVLETRKNIYNVSTPSWTFRYNPDNNQLSDIFNLDLTNQERIGKIKVFTSNVDYNLSTDNLAFYEFLNKAFEDKENPPDKRIAGARTIALSNLWETASGNSVALGAAPLVKRIESTDTEIYINPEYLSLQIKPGKNFGLVQFSSYLLINDEIIFYEGLEFEVFYSDSRPPSIVVLKSFDDYANLVNIDSQIKYLFITGKLKNVKRGQFGTKPRVHDPISPDNGLFNLRTFNLDNGSVQKQLAAPVFNIYNTDLNIVGNSSLSSKKLADITNNVDRRKFMTIATTQLDRGDYERFETTLLVQNRLNKNAPKDKDSIAGMAFSLNTSNMSGYYIQVILDETAEAAQIANVNLDRNPPANIRLFRYDGSINKLLAASNKFVSNNPYVYATFNVDENNEKEFNLSTVPEVFYNVQVVKKRKGSKMYFNVYINNELVIEEAVDDTPLSNNNGLGLYTRGDSRASFEYVAAWGIPTVSEELTATGTVGLSVDSMLGYYSEVILSGYFREGSKSISDYVKGKRFDFYPFAKEIRLIDAKFNQVPAAEVFLHMGPVADAYVDYAVLYSSPFRMNFLLLNESKRIVDFSQSVDGKKASYPKVIGYRITQQGKKEVEKSTYAESMVPTIATIDSPWVQGKDQLQAEDLAQFILKNSGGYDIDLGFNKDPIIIECEVVSNPLLQAGDIVKIEDPTTGLSSSTNSFIITTIEQSFNNGLETVLSLREVF